MKMQPINRTREQLDQAYPTVTIIIVTWNAASDIEECLTSMVSQTYTNFHIIIVDSNSSDETLEIVHNKFPTVQIMASTENVGYRRGNRLGMKIAEGDYVLVCNDDVRVEPTWLEEMVRTIESDKSIGLVTPLILDYDSPTLISAAGNTLLFTGTSAHSNARGQTKEYGYKMNRDLPAVSGCCFMMKRTLLHELGTFSEDFDHFNIGWHAGCEVADLAWRTQLINKRIELVPTSVMYHKHNWKTLQAERYVSHEWGRYLLLLRNYKVRTLILLTPLLICLELLSWGYSILKGRKWVRYKVVQWTWLFKNANLIRKMRARVQTTRLVSDAIILKRMNRKIEFGYAVDMGKLGYVFNHLLNLIFVTYHRFLCKTVK